MPKLRALHAFASLTLLAAATTTVHAQRVEENAYAYEQATHYRKPPPTVPPLAAADHQ